MHCKCAASVSLLLLNLVFLFSPRSEIDPETFAGNQIPILVIGCKADSAESLREQKVHRPSTVAEECGADELRLVSVYVCVCVCVCVCVRERERERERERVDVCFVCVVLCECVHVMCICACVSVCVCVFCTLLHPKYYHRCDGFYCAKVVYTEAVLCLEIVKLMLLCVPLMLMSA